MDHPSIHPIWTITKCILEQTQIQLIGWRFMDFSMILPIDTFIIQIKNILYEKHGVGGGVSTTSPDSHLAVATDGHDHGDGHNARQRRGPFQQLRLCKHEYKEYNEMTQDMKTLYDYGIEGGLKSEPPSMKILYQFVPHEESFDDYDKDDAATTPSRICPDPILLAWTH